MSAGYSGTPLARKLGIREGHDILLAAAPAELDDALRPLPPDTRVVRAEPTRRRAAEAGTRFEAPVSWMPGSRFDVVLVFCPDGGTLERRLPSAVSRIRWNGGLWVCWPKKRSELYRDLARERVREVGLATGLVDNKVCAVDDDWSGLRFVVRREDRPKRVETDDGPVARGNDQAGRA